MPRYIDADRAIVSAEVKCRDGLIGIETAENIASFLAKEPTANVQEVKHGEYIGEQQFGDCVRQHCSQCGCLVYVDNYCGHCGAKMDGE